MVKEKKLPFACAMFDSLHKEQPSIQKCSAIIEQLFVLRIMHTRKSTILFETSLSGCLGNITQPTKSYTLHHHNTHTYVIISIRERKDIECIVDATHSKKYILCWFEHTAQPSDCLLMFAIELVPKMGNLTSPEEGVIVVSFVVDESFSNPLNNMHGGAIATIVDLVVCCCN